MSDECDGLPLRILGPISVERNGAIQPIGGPLPRRLLAFLAVHRNTVVHVDRLIDMLWREAPPDTAVTTLRSHLSRLRQKLPPCLVLQTIAPGYRLEVHRDDVDADRFQVAASAAVELLRDDPGRALDRLDTAIELWRGPFLAEFAEEGWAQPEAVRFDELLLHVRELRTEALLVLGHVDTAIGEARRLALTHPERERSWTNLVRALHAAGRQREALACANEYRNKLRDESGLTPSANFVALERDVASEAPRPAPASPAAQRPSDPPGERQRAFSGAERSPLPDPSTSFHGRHREGEEVAALLRSERCVILLGAGGMGKTRLALHAARVAESDFPDGVWFSALADIRDDGLDAVPYSVAEALGIRPEQETPIVESIAEWIGQRRALLVLDNCEHVGAGVRDLVTLLLRQCRALTVLGTSREPLHVPGENRFFVGPLDSSSAGALFLDRVHAYDRASRPALAEDDVADLCDRLGNIPLALELAAARCRAVSPGELAARLEHRPDLLGDRSRPPAQQTLTAVLDWSVNHLPPAARQVFARLSVFRGGCSLDQAEAVIGGSGIEEADVLDALEQLVDAGLVTVARATPAVRYLQLEPIRQHGDRVLDADERAELSARHADAFARLATDIGLGMRGADVARWLDTAEGDLANLRTAHHWAVTHDQPDGAVAIVSGLREYLNERLTTELYDWNDATVAMTRGRGDRLEAAALAAAATAWGNQRRHDDVNDALDRVEAIPTADADQRAVTAFAAGWSRVNSGDPRTAGPIWRAGLETRPSAWYEGLLRASLNYVSSDDQRAVDELVDRLASPSLRIWYQIWNAKLFGSTERLRATATTLAGVIEQTARLGATHPHGVALFLRAYVLAQLPDQPLDDVLALLDQVITLWSDRRVHSQMLNPTVEGLAFALALRGHPEPAHTLFAVVEALGGTWLRPFSALVEPPLSSVPPATVEACRRRASEFANLRDVAAYAQSLIQSLRTDGEQPNRIHLGPNTALP